MKEKRKSPAALKDYAGTLAAPKAAEAVVPQTVRTEALSESDKGLVDNTKLKRELALERVKNALSQSENAELSYNNIILQLALKYNLKEGDIINEDGTIKRN